ncbi:helix-turn-helix domain-containing protein [Actinocrispum sp. NPDC049592]|uniref:helix-turn-helix domain-containing protein n=1 Tax=Actinocrispum sp. NPDC049592 TaxID=3154835 RepID=UPI003438FDAF
MLYSVEQVASLLGLHVKTVRGYVHDGKLNATKVGKQYRISSEDLAAFTGQPVTSGRHIDVSCVVQLDDVDFTLMSKITVMVTAYGTTPQEGERLRVETVYDQNRRTLKLIIVGGPGRVADVLEFVKTIAE